MGTVKAKARLLWRGGKERSAVIIAVEIYVRRSCLRIVEGGRKGNKDVSLGRRVEVIHDGGMELRIRA